MPGLRLILRFGGSSLNSPRRVRAAAERVRFHMSEGVWVAAVVTASTQASFRIARWLDRMGGQRTEGAARELDRAAAAAEQETAALLAAALAAIGVPGVSLRADEAGVSGEGGFGAGSLLGVDPGPLGTLAEAGAVGVVGGSQVFRSDGEVVMLRPRSADIIAVAIADAIGAHCHFVTDRESLDPMLRTGQLVHPSAVQWAEERNVPVKAYSFRAAFESMGL